MDGSGPDIIIENLVVRTETLYIDCSNPRSAEIFEHSVSVVRSINMSEESVSISHRHASDGFKRVHMHVIYICVVPLWGSVWSPKWVLALWDSVGEE